MILTNIVLSTEIVLVVLIIYVIYKLVGYITCKVLVINCNSLMFAVIGFCVSLLIHTVVAIPMSLMNVGLSKEVISKFSFIVLLFYFSYGIIKHKKEIDIKYLFAEKQNMCFVLLFVVFQIIVMYISVRNYSLDEAKVILDGLQESYPIDMYFLSMSQILHINLWIIGVPVAANLKIIFYTIIIHNIGILIYENKDKQYTFTFISVVFGFLFFYGGNLGTPISKGVIGESLYELTYNDEVWILTVMMQLLAYSIIALCKKCDNSSKNLLMLTAAATGLVKYTGAFLTLIIVSAYIFVVIIREKKIKNSVVLWLKVCVVPLVVMIIKSTKLEITHFLYFKDLYMIFWQYNWVTIITIITLMMYILFTKNKSENIIVIRKSIVVPSIIIMIVMMNPTVTKFTGKFWGYADLQNKVWWCIPCTIIFAFGMIELYKNCKEYVILSTILGLLLVLHIYCNHGWNNRLFENYGASSTIEELSKISPIFLGEEAIDMIIEERE